MGVNEAAETHSGILTATTVGHFAGIMRKQKINLCENLAFASRLYFKLSQRAGDVYIWKRRALIMQAVSNRVRVFWGASEEREEDKAKHGKSRTRERRNTEGM